MSMSLFFTSCVRRRSDVYKICNVGNEDNDGNIGGRVKYIFC